MITEHTFWQRSHLAHELRDDAVEGGTLVAETLLASAEGAEVLSGLGDHIGVELQRQTLSQTDGLQVDPENNQPEGRGWAILCQSDVWLVAIWAFSHKWSRSDTEEDFV